MRSKASLLANGLVSAWKIASTESIERTEKNREGTKRYQGIPDWVKYHADERTEIQRFQGRGNASQFWNRPKAVQKDCWRRWTKQQVWKEVVKKSDWQWHQCCLHLLCLTSFDTLGISYVWLYSCTAKVFAAHYLPGDNFKTFMRASKCFSWKLLAQCWYCAFGSIKNSQSSTVTVVVVDTLWISSFPPVMAESNKAEQHKTCQRVSFLQVQTTCVLVCAASTKQNKQSVPKVPQEAL